MKGISKRTTKLGFHILRLHYSADPAKDLSTPEGKLWYEEARKGMSEQRWKQEHEIDYGALGGQLVFPGFDEGIHVVPNMMPINPAYSTIWLACDPHPRTAHAFLWLAAHRGGELAVVWSWWPKERHEREGLVTKDYAEALKEIDKSDLNLKPRYRLMDVAGRSFNAEEEKSYFDKYREYGIYFNPAKKNRDLIGFDLINTALMPASYAGSHGTEQRPKLTIWSDCGDNDELVRQMKSLRYREWKGNVTDKDAPEEPEQKDRHLVDCLSYILLDDPHFREKKAQSSWEPLYPSNGEIPGGTGY
jgi:hypothetical protein